MCIFRLLQIQFALCGQNEEKPYIDDLHSIAPNYRKILFVKLLFCFIVSPWRLPHCSSNESEWRMLVMASSFILLSSKFPITRNRNKSTKILNPTKCAATIYSQIFWAYLLLLKFNYQNIDQTIKYLHYAQLKHITVTVALCLTRLIYLDSCLRIIHRQNENERRQRTRAQKTTAKYPCFMAMHTAKRNKEHTKKKRINRNALVQCKPIYLR